MLFDFHAHILGYVRMAKSDKIEQYIDNEISVLESDLAVINFFKKMDRFNQIDKSYREEQRYLEEVRVWTTKVSIGDLTCKNHYYKTKDNKLIDGKGIVNSVTVNN